jgi:hypothetical protein
MGLMLLLPQGQVKGLRFSAALAREILTHFPDQSGFALIAGRKAEPLRPTEEGYPFC